MLLSASKGITVKSITGLQQSTTSRRWAVRRTEAPAGEASKVAVGAEVTAPDLEFLQPLPNPHACRRRRP